MMRHFFSSFWMALLLITSAAALTYSNALHNPFLLDDHTFFDTDIRMATPGKLWNYFIPDMKKALVPDSLSRGLPYYRPLAHVIPMACYMAFGDDVFKYHLVNWLLFVALCFTLYYFLLLVAGDPIIALVTALFFCLHPINGLMVNYITADVFAVQLLLMLGCAILFWKNKGGIFSQSLALSLVCFALALLCHETSMAMPFYLCVLVFLQSVQGRGKWLALLPFGVLLLGYWFFRLYCVSLDTTILRHYADFHVNAAEYLASLLRLMGWYVGRLFYPDGIVLIWVTHPVRAFAWLWVMVLGALAVGMVLLLRHYYRTDKFSLVAVLWFLIGFVPVGFATLFRPEHGFLFEPHWMFFASIGFFWWFSLQLRRMTARYFLVVVLALLVPLITVSRAYNVLWSDEEKYCLYWLKQVPDYPQAMFYLGTLYTSQGKISQARELYAKCAEDWGIINNLGLLEVHEKRYNEARRYFQQALKLYPNAALVYTNLGIVESVTGHQALARKYWAKAVELNHFLLHPRYLLAEDYIRRQDFAPAIELLKGNLEMELDDDRSLFDLVLVYLVTHQGTEAVNAAHRIMAHSHDRELLNKLAAMTAQFGLAVGDMYH